MYILYSLHSDKFYIGFTGNDVQLRLSRHLANHGGFTSRVKDWEIVYQENFATKAEAMSREKEIKGWKSKKRLKELIAGSSIE